MMHGFLNLASRKWEAEKKPPIFIGKPFIDGRHQWQPNSHQRQLMHNTTPQR